MSTNRGNKQSRERKYVTIGEAAQLLGVSIDTVRRWEKTGRLSAERLDGKNRHFDIDHLESYRQKLPLSTTEVAQLLGVSASTVRRLEHQGLLVPERAEKGHRYYSRADVDRYLLAPLETANGMPLMPKAARAGIAFAEAGSGTSSSSRPVDTLDSNSKQPVSYTLSHDDLQSLLPARQHSNIIQRIIIYAIAAMVALVSVFVFLLVVFPDTMSGLFWREGGSQGGVVARIFKPFADRALDVVEVISPGTHEKIQPLSIDDVADVFGEDESGQIIASYVFSPPSSSYLKIPDQGLVVNLNSEFVQGYEPGTSDGSLAVIPVSGEQVADDSIEGADIADSAINLEHLSEEVLAALRSSGQLQQSPGITEETGDIESVIAGIGLTGGAHSGSATLDIALGSSVTTVSGLLEIKLPTSGSTLANTSNSGLEITSDGVRLLGGCSAGQLLKWNGANWLCSSDVAGGGSFDVQESGVTVTSPVSALNFAGNEFVITDNVGQANIAIDYTNSDITRSSQNETITGTWSFGSVDLGTVTSGIWQGSPVGAQYGGTGINGATAANGRLLIGNGSGYTLANLTAGSGILVTNGSGSISIAASLGTSVGNSEVETNAVNLTTQTTGNYVATLGTLTGLSTTGNSGEGSTPTLTVLYGSTANTAVQGNTQITCPSGTGNLTGGGTTITLGTGGSCGNLSTNNAVSFATSVTTPLVAGSNLTLNASAGDLTLDASGSVILGGTNCSVFTNGGVLTTDASGNIVCGNDDSGGGGSLLLEVKEGGTTVIAGAASIDFLGADFAVTSSITEADIAIDYVNSGITRRTSSETIAGSWTFNDSGFTVQDNVDSSKKLQIQVSSIATNTTRTLTAPNTDGTLITTGNLTDITTVGTISSGIWEGNTIGAQYGGTGLNGGAAGNGQLLIGNGTGYSLAALSQGSGISVTNGAGSITLATTLGASVQDSEVDDDLTISAGGTVDDGALSTLVSLLGQTVEGGEITDGSIALATDTTGNYVATLGTLTGLSTTGNSGEGSTPTLTVLYGSTANTAVQGNTQLTVTAGTNLSGGGTITLGSGGSVTVNTVANPSFGTSVSSPLFTNAGGATFSATGVGSDITLDSADQIIFDGFDCSAFDNGGVLTTDASGNITCDNDDGGAGGALTGSGTTNRVPLYTGATSLGNSWLLQNGSTLQLDNTRNLEILGGNFTVNGTVSATGFSGSGASLTSLNASSVSSGTLADARLSTNVTTAGNTFNGSSQLVQLTVGGALPALDGSSLTSVNASQLGGQAGSYYLDLSNATSTLNDARLSGNVTLAGNTFNGASELIETTAAGLYPALNGSLITDVDAASLGGQVGGYYLDLVNATGTLAIARIADGSLTNAKLQNSSVTISAGDGLGSGGSVSLGGSVALTVLYGSTANTAVQGNTQITCPSGTGNLTGGGTTITLGTGGSCGNLSTNNAVSFATSVTSPLFTNAGTVMLSATGVGNDLTLSAADQVILDGFNCGTFDNGGVLTTDASGNVVCDNDDGGAAGTITGSGAANRIPLYTGAQSLGSSWLAQNGSDLELDNARNLELVGGNLVVAGTGSFTGLLTANGGVTLGVGDTLTINGDALTDLTGTGLQIVANALETTLGTSVQNGEVDDDLTISAAGSVSDGALSALVSLLGQSIDDGEVDDGISISASGSVADGALSSNVSLLGATIDLATAEVAGNLRATGLQNLAADLGAADVNINLGNTNGSFNTNLTLDGIITASSFSGVLTGNASTASALAANPTDCSANQFAAAIAANGNLTCASLTDGDIPNTITIDLAAAASALAANPTDCAANTFANAIAANGNLTCTNITDADIPNGITVDLAATAAALASDPSDCNANQFATTINAAGNLTCAAIQASNLPSAATDLGAANVTINLANSNGSFVTNLSLDGTVTASIFSGNLSGNVTGDVTGNVSGNAATATALLANPSDCAANQFATAIAADGDLACAALADADIPNTITIDLAAAATALAANPTDCAVNTFANAIAASGNLGCTAIAANNLPTAAADLGAADINLNISNSNGSFNTNLTLDGSITAAGFIGALTGNASTASSLAANPSDCAANQFANAIAANGNLTCAAITDADVSNTLTASIFIGSGSTTNAIDLATAEVAGTLAAANGGTGQSSYTVGDLLYASSSSALSRLAAAATGNVLISGGAGAAPSWGKITNSHIASGTYGNITGTGALSSGSIASGFGTINTGNSITGASLHANDGLDIDCNANQFVGNPTIVDGVATAGACENDDTGLSDSSLKTNVLARNVDLADIASLNVVDYNFKCLDVPLLNLDLGCEDRTGVIAQEIQAIFPELVSTHHTGYLAVREKSLMYYGLQATTQMADMLDGDGSITVSGLDTDTLTVNSGATLTGGIDNNSGGITEAGTLAGVTGITSSGSFTLGLNNLLADASLTVSNSSVTGVANVNLGDGSLQTNGTTRLTNGGALQNITGLAITSGGASVTGGIDNNSGGITEAGGISGIASLGSTGNVTFDLNSLSNTGLTITNSGLTGVANLNLAEGALQTNGTTRLTNAGALQNITGLVVSSGGASVTGGLNNNGDGITNAGALSGVSTITASGNINTTGVYQRNGTSGTTASCSGSNYPQNLNVSGGIVTSFGCAGVGLSDERLKIDVVELDGDILEQLRQVRAVSFDFDCSHDFFAQTNTVCDERRQAGVIAQELAQVFPELVYEEDGYYRVKYDSLAIYNLRAVSEISKMIDSSQNAHFASLTVDGTIEAGTLRVANLEGLDYGERLDDLETRVGLLETGGQAADIDLSNLQVGSLDVSLDLLVGGGLTVSGPAEFRGSTVFDAVVAFGDSVSFDGDVEFSGRTNFSSDTGGYAIIKPGAQSVHVSFDRPFLGEPIVSLSLGDGKFARYSHTNVTANGFDIVLDQPAAETLNFSWIALSVEQPNTFVQE